jgi:hypothetical protein
MHKICQSFLFHNVTIGPANTPFEPALEFLNFLSSHSEMRCEIRSVRLELRGMKYNTYNPFHLFLDRVLALLPTLDSLRNLTYVNQQEKHPPSCANIYLLALVVMCTLICMNHVCLMHGRCRL